MSIVITASSHQEISRAKILAARYQLPFVEHAPLDETHWQIQVNADDISLQAIQNNKPHTLKLDFTAGHLAYRRQHSGRKQAISRACGLHKQSNLRILDANAGLGRDGFILASLTANVLMLERVNVLAILLEDAIVRLHQHDPEIHLQVQWQDSKDYLANYSGEPFDVIYLDPMFPSRQKTALVKQEMRFLRALVGDDQDADDLLQLALPHAKQRVVVKRAKHAPPLAGKSPSFSQSGESTRYDIYLLSGSVTG